MLPQLLAINLEKQIKACTHTPSLIDGRDILHLPIYIHDHANPLTARIRTAISAALSE